MTDLDLIARALAPYPNLFDQLNAALTHDAAFGVFERISNTYSPSLTARHTAGVTIGELLASARRHPRVAFYQNYLHTGNTALELGDTSQKPIWLLAHMDIISFLTRERADDGYPLTPYCVPRADDGAYPAVALGNSAVGGRLPEIASGELVVRDAGRQFLFRTDATLPPATRVVYAARAEWQRDTNMLYGYTDDAAGCAALTLAAQVLAPLAVDALFVFCDEEEGVVAPGPRAFSRGSDRLFRRAPAASLPNFVVVSDGQDYANGMPTDLAGHRFGDGATFAAFASDTKGAVTPPRLLDFERSLAMYLAEHGVALRENTGYVSRSDDVSATGATPNIAIVGLPAAYSHFARTPRIHLDDLINLAKSLVVFVLVAQSAEWQAAVLA